MHIYKVQSRDFPMTYMCAHTIIVEKGWNFGMNEAVGLATCMGEKAYTVSKSFKLNV